MSITRREFGIISQRLPAYSTRARYGRVRASFAISNRCYYFAVIADSHIIDSLYHGQESSAFDTESLQLKWSIEWRLHASS